MDEKEIDRLHTQHMESMKFQVDLALQTLKLLFLLNGVAAVAFLGFMGHKSPQPLPCAWSAGVLCFAIGVVLTIGANFSAYLFQAAVSKNNRDRFDYHNNRKNYMDYKQSLENGEKITKEIKKYYEEIFDYLNKLREEIHKSFSNKYLWGTIGLGLAPVGFFFAGVLFVLHGFNVSCV